MSGRMSYRHANTPPDRAIGAGRRGVSVARRKMSALPVGMSLLTLAACGTYADEGSDSAALSGQEPLRVYAADAHGALSPVALDRLPKTPAPKLSLAASADTELVEKTMDLAESTRTSGLLSARRVRNQPGRAEDGSLRVSTFHVSAGGEDRTYLGYPGQLAQIGAVEGFNVVLRTPVADQVRAEAMAATTEGLERVVLLSVPNFGDQWSEDQGEVDAEGNVSLPAPIEDVSAMAKVAFRERLERLYPGSPPGAEADPEKYPLANFGMNGNVAKERTQIALGSLAVANRKKVRSNFSYVEGGNMLVGRLEGGEPYALVGKDSLATTRYALEIDLRHKVTDAEILANIAADLGVAPENLHPVEQPGDFHLDMRMALWGPGTVLLDDAHAAVAAQLDWMQEDLYGREPKANAPAEELTAFVKAEEELQTYRDNLEAYAKRQAEFEAIVVRDLEKAHLKVVRVPAVYPSPAYTTDQSMNFMNGESGTNARGEKFYIALGGHARAERAFAASMQKLGGLSRLYFLDRQLTETTLKAHGGISSRVKADGQDAPL